MKAENLITFHGTKITKSPDELIPISDVTSYPSIKVDNPITFHDAKVIKSPDESISISDEFMKGIEGSFYVLP